MIVAELDGKPVRYCDIFKNCTGEQVITFQENEEARIWLTRTKMRLGHGVMKDDFPVERLKTRCTDTS